MDFLIFSFWFRLSSSSTSFLKKHSFLNKCGSKESSYLYAGAATLVWIGRFYSFCYMKWGHSRTIFRHICQHMFTKQMFLTFLQKVEMHIWCCIKFSLYPEFLNNFTSPQWNLSWKIYLKLVLTRSFAPYSQIVGIGVWTHTTYTAWYLIFPLFDILTLVEILIICH